MPPDAVAGRRGRARGRWDVIRTGARRAFPWLAWLYVAGLLVQVFLAGMAIFNDPATFHPRRLRAGRPRPHEPAPADRRLDRPIAVRQAVSRCADRLRVPDQPARGAGIVPCRGRLASGLRSRPVLARGPTRRPSEARLARIRHKSLVRSGGHTVDRPSTALESPADGGRRRARRSLKTSGFVSSSDAASSPTAVARDTGVMVVQGVRRGSLRSGETPQGVRFRRSRQGGRSESA